MKLTRIDILNLNYILKTAVFDLPICGRFRYMLTKNVELMEKEIADIEDAFPAPASYVEYQKAEAEIYKKFNVNTIDAINALEEEKRADLDSSLDALRDKYVTAIEEFNAIQEEKKLFLKEEVEINLRTVKASDVPNISADNKQNHHWEIWGILSKIVVDD